TPPHPPRSPLPNSPPCASNATPQTRKSACTVHTPHPPDQVSQVFRPCPWERCGFQARLGIFGRLRFLWCCLLGLRIRGLEVGRKGGRIGRRLRGFRILERWSGRVGERVWRVWGRMLWFVLWWMGRWRKAGLAFEVAFFASMV